MILILIAILGFLSCSNNRGTDQNKSGENKITDTEQVILKEQEEKLTKSLSFIILALESYYYENSSTYPESIDKLLEKGMLNKMPDNPVTNSPMKMVEFGSSESGGNFTYLPFDVDASGSLDGFYLIGYGSDKAPGEDIDMDGKPDHVIVKFQSGFCENTPELKTLLK